MIFTNLAPNAKLRDLRILSSFFLLPWKWKEWYEGKSLAMVQTWLQDYLGTSNVYLLDSGRSALLVALRAMKLKEGDEVIVPGYTCIVVTNAIRAVGAIPKLIDIGDNLNIDVSRIEKEIRPHTKAILAQHTFGLPCDTGQIRELCDQYNLCMIEDCAHALGAHVGGQPVGTIADVAFFSFGSDKIVSSVRGGALAVHNSTLLDDINDQYDALPHMPRKLLWQHICYISAFAKLKVCYRYGGKAILYVLRRLNITAVITEPEEKKGTVANWTPVRYPNILASHVYPQLRKLYEIKMKRRIIAQYYIKHLPENVLLSDYAQHTERTYLHFPIRIERVEEYRQYMKQRGIQIGTDWNGAPIVPKQSTQIDTETAMIPVAKTLSNKIVQLPIHQNITVRKAKRVVYYTVEFLNTAENLENS